ncbi:hypothetical protein JCM10207_003571 [Rhodosporidiobolus poonsookiae]
MTHTCEHQHQCQHTEHSHDYAHRLERALVLAALLQSLSASHRSDDKEHKTRQALATETNVAYTSASTTTDEEHRRRLEVLEDEVVARLTQHKVGGGGAKSGSSTRFDELFPRIGQRGAAMSDKDRLELVLLALEILKQGEASHSYSDLAFPPSHHGHGYGTSPLGFIVRETGQSYPHRLFLRYDPIHHDKIIKVVEVDRHGRVCYECGVPSMYKL